MDSAFDAEEINLSESPPMMAAKKQFRRFIDSARGER